MKVNRLSIASLLAAACTAAAVQIAPIAAAAPSGPQNCTSSGDGNSLCESPGNAQIVATPPQVYSQQWDVYPFGPLIALNDHHRYR